MKAKYDGGAIAVDPAVGQVIITDKTDNVVQAQNGTDSDSGSDSVEALAKLYLSDTSFLGNIAGERGGSIYSTSVGFSSRLAEVGRCVRRLSRVNYVRSIPFSLLSLRDYVTKLVVCVRGPTVGVCVSCVEMVC